MTDALLQAQVNYRKGSWQAAEAGAKVLFLGD